MHNPFWKGEVKGELFWSPERRSIGVRCEPTYEQNVINEQVTSKNEHKLGKWSKFFFFFFRILMSFVKFDGEVEWMKHLNLKEKEL